MEQNSIVVKNVTKKFDDFMLDHISFTVPTGRIVGFIGENGAGKSTTINLILDQLKLDAGEIRILGKQNHSYLHKENIGVVFDECKFHSVLNAKDIAQILSGSYKTWDMNLFEEYMKRLDVPLNKSIGQLSKGMKMKLSIICALSHRPQILILDEATTGLDPVVRDEILDILEAMFPDAHCELIHKNPFELLVAVVLSAQTTDEAVNKVTPGLFAKFPTPEAMANASLEDIEACIKRIGLYRNKAKSVQVLSKALVERFHSEVPHAHKDLTSLAGVGRKTANVVQSVCFDIPAIAVDTHVERISKRLGLAKVYDNVETVEKKLKRKIRKERWNKAHHLFIFFGRYYCTAKNPHCEGCPFVSICKKDKLDTYKSNKKK